MARRRKSRKARRSYSPAIVGRVRRRSRNRSASMNGVMDNVLDTLLAIAGGAAGAFSNKVIPAAWNKKLVAGGKILAGVVLPMAARDAKTKNALAAAGHGLAVVGGIEMLQSFGVLSGLGADESELAVSLEGIEDIDYVDMSGTDDVNVINGDAEDVSVINGNEDVLGESVLAGDDEDYM